MESIVAFFILVKDSYNSINNVSPLRALCFVEDRDCYSSSQRLLFGDYRTSQRPTKGPIETGHEATVRLLRNFENGVIASSTSRTFEFDWGTGVSSKKRSARTSSPSMPRMLQWMDIIAAVSSAVRMTAHSSNSIDSDNSCCNVVYSR